MPVLAETTVVVAPGYEWHPIRFRDLPAMGTFRTNYVRAFCSGGTDEQVRELGNRLNDGRGMQAWSVEYVYNMLGQWGYPVTQILGHYRLWAVDDEGQLVDARGQPID